MHKSMTHSAPLSKVTSQTLRRLSIYTSQTKAKRYSVFSLGPFPLHQLGLLTLDLNLQCPVTEGADRDVAAGNSEMAMC